MVVVEEVEKRVVTGGLDMMMIGIMRKIDIMNEMNINVMTIMIDTDNIYVSCKYL